MQSLYSSHFLRPPSIPDYIHDVLCLASNGDLDCSPPSDPCFSSTPYLIFSSRRECEKFRAKLNAYRSHLRKLSLNPKHPHQADALFFVALFYSCRIAMRNPSYPHISNPITLWTLPDGPHHIYFPLIASDSPPAIISRIRELRAADEVNIASYQNERERLLKEHDDKSAFTEALSDLGYIPSPNPDSGPAFSDLTGSSDALSDLDWISPELGKKK